MIQCADRYLGILYDYLHKELYRYHVFQADETSVMVSKDGRPANSMSYMWIYRTGKNYKNTPIVLYEYQRTRKADHPREFRKGFTGVVVCDGYSAYRKLDQENPDIILQAAGSMQGGISRTHEKSFRKRRKKLRKIPLRMKL